MAKKQEFIIKYNIVVSGAAEVGHCCDKIEELSREVGKQIALEQHTLVTGATTGVPYFAAQGCKEAGGFNIGFSPATSEKEHIKSYKLPLDPFDIMIYTGGDYVGRDITMTKSADGIVLICGRNGTLHEFATAAETDKPIAVLEGTGGTADKIRGIVEDYWKVSKKIIYDRDPKSLVKRLIREIDKKHKEDIKVLEIYENKKNNK